MKVTRDMIDPQIWAASSRTRALTRFLGSSDHVKSWRRAKGLLRFMIGRDVKGLDCSTVWLDRPDGTKLRVRVYRPAAASTSTASGLPGMLWIHGGGYAIGVPEQNGTRFRELIDLRPAVIVSPDYGLSVDAPYPAALDDCYLTLTWMHDHADELGVDRSRLIVGGESAGGGLTAAVTLYARDQGKVPIAFQIPLYPMIDDRETASSTDNDAPIWDSSTNRAAWDLYLGPLAGSDDVPAYAAPARATDYRGLPPTFTFVGDIEPFHDETVAYVESLRAAGVPVEFDVYPGAFHGFDGLAAKADASKKATAKLFAAYARAVDTSSRERAS